MSSPPDPAGDVTVALHGEIDVSTADAVRATLIQALGVAGTRRLRIDMADVVFVDSTALGALIAVRRAGDERGVRLAVVNANQRVRRILTMTSLAPFLGLDAAAGDRPA